MERLFINRKQLLLSRNIYKKNEIFVIKMELNVISKSKNKLVFELKGEGHTFCNILRDELWNEKDVIASGYHIKHPLVGIPKFIAETKSSEVTTALESASKSVKKKFQDFKKSFSSL